MEVAHEKDAEQCRGEDDELLNGYEGSWLDLGGGIEGKYVSGTVHEDTFSLLANLRVIISKMLSKYDLPRV